MKSKPGHLGPEFAAQFSDASVAAHYHLRPPYPEEVFTILAELIVDSPRAVLDVGAGTGEIARRLIDFVDRVDAVDPSVAMIKQGRGMPGGRSAKISWITGFAEDAPLVPPYALITAGASLHWMQWETVLPRLRDALSAHGVLAIIESHERRAPWASALQEIIPRYSTNRRFRPLNVVDEIERRGLFETLGRTMTAPVRHLQPTTDYVASFHARNGFSLDRMTPEAASAFDRAALKIVSPYANDAGRLELQIVGEVVWGRPAPG
ncbi:MAG TPA: class I SAM-dependent methyltransferase [Thermomicrobiales bacterium]|nr:class I SAM-dependent methyltransferase [Thermomicrobiales bacterium]